MDEFDPEILGGCYVPEIDGNESHPDPIDVMFNDVQQWYFFPAGQLPDPQPIGEPNEWNDEPVAPIDLRNAVTRSSDPMSAANVFARPYERLYVAGSHGADIFLGYRSGDETEVAVAVLGSDVAFLSDCAHELYTVPLKQFADYVDRDAARAFRGLVEGDLSIETLEEWVNPA